MKRHEVLPHIRIDRQKKLVAVNAEVVFDPHLVSGRSQGPPEPDRGGWLELVACTPGMRAYESLVAVACRPRHLHQALLMVGLVPGVPMKVARTPVAVKVTSPHGPLVDVSVSVQRKGVCREVPMGEWIIDRKTGEILKDSQWIFAGSTFHAIDGRNVYLADLNGAVVSLVNFGDDVLCRATRLTNRDDGQVFAANVDAVPPAGTAVTLLFRAAQRSAVASRPLPFTPPRAVPPTRSEPE